MQRDTKIAVALVVMWLAAQVDSCFGVKVDPFNKVGTPQRVAITRDPHCPPDDPAMPNSRHVSVSLCTMQDKPDNPSRAKNALMFFGQLMAHEIIDTLKKAGHPPLMDVDSDDPHFGPKGVTRIALFPSADGAPNMATPLIDGSTVYGSTQRVLDAVREGTSPFLRTRNGGLLPFLVEGVFINTRYRPGGTQRLCGDHRCSENPALATLHNIFVRAHNIFANEYKEDHPGAPDDEVFEATHDYIVALMQKITYEEYLPALIGKYAVCEDPGSNNIRDGSYQIPAWFAHAGFRLHHLISGKISPELAEHVADTINANSDHNASPVRPEDMTLVDTFFNSEIFQGPGRDLGIHVRSMFNTPAMASNPEVTPEMQNFMFANKSIHSGMDDVGMDIATFTMNHTLSVLKADGEYGIATYNDVRVHLGRPAARHWSDVTSDTTRQHKLSALYRSPRKLEAWIGLVSEDQAPTSSLGLTMSLGIGQEFCAMAASDPNFYTLGKLSDYAQAKLDQDGMSALVCRTTGECGVHPTEPFTSPITRSPLHTRSALRTRRSRTIALVDDE